MNRRELLAGIGAASALPAIARAETVGRALDLSPSRLSPLGRAAHEAYIYALPLIESATARAGLLTHEKGRPGQLFHLREPTTPATQRVTTSNNDTLNSRGWFDLAQGPVRLRWPATGDRYFSVAMMDMYSNNFAVLGARTTGPDGGDVTIVGPDAPLPPGGVHASTRWMWILIRTLTTGGADLAAAHRVQDGFRIDAPAYRGDYGTFARRDAAWPDYFASAGRLMAENPGPATDTAILRRIAPLALARFDAARFSAAEAREIAAGVASARALLAAQTAKGLTVSGWMYPRASLGDFRQDYLYRGQTALNAFAALPNDEAIYLFATGPRDDLILDSAVSWRLHLTRDQLPPADGFWSLASYRATPDGQFFLFDNPIQRYSIGDRTPGLVRGDDGGIDIVLQRGPLDANTRGNWLPTPQDAPFGAVFRIYRPRQPVIDGAWRLPALERIVQKRR